MRLCKQTTCWVNEITKNKSSHCAADFSALRHPCVTKKLIVDLNSRIKSFFLCIYSECDMGEGIDGYGARVGCRCVRVFFFRQSSIERPAGIGAVAAAVVDSTIATAAADVAAAVAVEQPNAFHAS